MSSPDQIDQRFEELVRELRSGRVSASPELRERVRAIASEAPQSKRRKPLLEHISWRRAVLVLGPACVVAGVGAALLQGLTSGTSQPAAADQPTVVRRAEARAPVAVPRPQTTQGRATWSVAAPPSSSRLQDYRVSMRVRVPDLDALSKATVRAMRVTRSLGGYVADVRYSSPSVRHGDAVLVLRIPIANVQRAVLAYSGLGTIVAQSFSVIDLQKRNDAEVQRIAKLRVEIARLEARLATEALTDVDRAHVREQLEYARAERTRLTATHRTTLNRARLATARLSLTTFHKKQRQPVAAPSRFDRTLDDAAGVLGRELVWLLYGLVVAAPFLLLGLIALAAGRSHRRRAERRLLAAMR